MSEQHRMTLEADDGDGVLLVCVSGCGRRLVVKRSGGLVVLDRGDFFALHTGGSEGLQISATLGP
jgi:ABC-type iron transport system FetAB ATPase subunit